MAASAATVDINIQSFGSFGSLSTASNDPNIADALAARDAFIGGGTIRAFEGFENFTACPGSGCSSTAGGLDTDVGTFNVGDGADQDENGGAIVAPTNEAVVKSAVNGDDSFGRYNVAADAGNNHEGGNWLDSNDWSSVEWDIPGVSGLTNFGRIAFFLTDVNDSGNVRFEVNAGGVDITDTTKAITGDTDNGMLNLVTMQFSEAVSGDVLIKLTNASGNTGGDGFGIDTITVSSVPLPAAGWLMIAGLGGLAAMRRRKRAA
jgi:hypothetical protein